MISRLSAFRPARTVQRLPPRSAACPLSFRDLLAPAAELGLVLPLVRAPSAAVARGALVAAKALGSALGLALPRGGRPDRWFAEVTAAADEVAAGLPLLLAGEVVVAGEGALDVERAVSETWALVDAGLTHVSIDGGAVAAPERGRVLAEVAAPAVERGLGVDWIVPLEDASGAAPRAIAGLQALVRRGFRPDLAAVRCPAPADEAAARAQADTLARLALALRGTPVMRCGPVTPALLGALQGSPVRACEDGGAAEERAAVEPGATAPGEEAERREARAFAEVTDLVEGLGAAGSAAALVSGILRRHEERGP
ncbi:hypothetical protein [Anaeromyxobacter terrae]|uniref:hypothetical protein n=1 Tax=Anaeromyxobacter terrae TaxID=2925406 RepID=UPI001F5A9EE2|nr:hypothetical protein [Anaeromyxobacter sp. SG22]